MPHLGVAIVRKEGGRRPVSLEPIKSFELVGSVRCSEDRRNTFECFSLHIRSPVHIHQCRNRLSTAISAMGVPWHQQQIGCFIRCHQRLQLFLVSARSPVFQLPISPKQHMQNAPASSAWVGFCDLAPLFSFRAAMLQLQRRGTKAIGHVHKSNQLINTTFRHCPFLQYLRHQTDSSQSAGQSVLDLQLYNRANNLWHSFQKVHTVARVP